MSELNRAPQPRAFWDVGASECSSDSESAPASKQCRQHPEPVEVEEPVTADDETDMSFLMSMAMKSQRMASGHSGIPYSLERILEVQWPHLVRDGLQRH